MTNSDKEEKKIVVSSFNNQLREEIKEHFLFLRGDRSKKSGDFSNIFFKNGDMYGSRDEFTEQDLSQASFKNSDVSIINFKGCRLNGTDFRGSIFSPQQFTSEQRKVAIFTDEDFERHQNLKKLEEENKNLKKINEEQEEKIDEIGDERTNELVKGFEDIRKEFSLEERRWMLFSVCAFLEIFTFLGTCLIFSISLNGKSYILYTGVSIMLFLFSTPVFGLLATLKSSKTTWKDYGSILVFLFVFFSSISWIHGKLQLARFSDIHINIALVLSSVGLIMFSFLYFCIFQYSKAKHLRIENQNRIALLYGYQALKAEKGDGVEKGRFYNNIADVVFSKVYTRKNDHKNLPLDELIEIVKVVRGIDSGSKKE